MEATVKLDSTVNSVKLFGQTDNFLRSLRKSTSTKITARKNTVTISGTQKNVNETIRIIHKMQDRLTETGHLTGDDVEEFIAGHRFDHVEKDKNTLIVYSGKKIIEPTTAGQAKYIQAMLTNDLTFCTGPAGTGKTYLAVAMAVSALRQKHVRRIILARPAVEAGEKLGFLPGDLQAKVNPYLRPLFDAIEDMMNFAQMRKFMELDIIEIIPLAFMRGRTLNESIVICDEAQNTSPMQMLMILTRLGRGSKMIITGDTTQIDLEKGQKSGMIEAMETLKRIKGIGTIELAQKDIIRHRLVQNIVRAYKKKNNAKG